MKVIFSSIFICIILGSSIPKKTESNLCELINRGFTKAEVSQLHELLYFFDSIVLKQTKSNSIDSAYFNYMKKLSNAESVEDLLNKLKCDKPKIDSFISEYKRVEVFKELWFYEYGKSKSNGDTITFQLIPNLNGKYNKIINKAIKFNSLFKGYKKEIKVWETLPPTLIGSFQFVYDKLEFTNEFIRLIVAIHYYSVISYSELNKENKFAYNTVYK